MSDPESMGMSSSETSNKIRNKKQIIESSDSDREETTEKKMSSDKDMVNGVNTLQSLNSENQSESESEVLLSKKAWRLDSSDDDDV